MSKCVRLHDGYEPSHEEIGYRTAALQDAYYSGSVPGLGAWERVARESIRLEKEAVDAEIRRRGLDTVKAMQ